MLDEACDVEYGTRVVKKRDGGSVYPVYGGGGATFHMDEFNREDRLVIARFGISEECTRFVEGKFFLNDSGLTVSPKNGALNQRYLDYHILSLNDVIFGLGRGTAQKNLDVSAFRSLPLLVPPLPEQQRIVGLLDEAFDCLATARAHAEQNLANARALFESHLNAVFRQRGEGWEETTLGDLATVSTGPFGSLLHKSDYVEDGVPLVNPINIVDDRIVPDTKKQINGETKQRLESYILQEADIVLGRRGEIGRCAVVGPEESGWICGTGSFFIRPSASIESHFLAHLIRSPHYRSKLEEVATGTTMKNLSNKSLQNLSRLCCMKVGQA